MLTLLEVFAPIAVILLISLPLIPVLSGKVSAKNAKYRVLTQVSVFAGVFLAVMIFQVNGLVAKAAEATTTASGFAGSNAQGMGFLAAAIATSASAGISPGMLSRCHRDGSSGIGLTTTGSFVGGVHGGTG